jgi:hypothetical protein
MTTTPTMTLRCLLMIVISVVCLTNCATEKTKNVLPSDTLSIGETIDSLPKVAVKIAIADTVVKYGDNVMITMSLTNTAKNKQRLLFDKPAVSTAGPWSTIGWVTDKATGKSILRHQNKAVWSSEIYGEDELKDNYYYLQTNQTISRQYELDDIVVVDTENYVLPRGTFEVQLFYHNTPSNVLTVRVE